ncbi:proline iminopeptidase [Thioalkalivibrio sulfidiphilus HL-EbGr7]|uniref:Proline iminopeptidase n=1 Tax=Thioalkalivibrio sulfidiphilus (strain HL-EbGR7) TaxID=396588 RepID=B8GU24_THISH|nr:prolyl aminopeptidase [Thioalkalivibrio sulfidiphilus]ACL71307.1 proline iminopeptidase [Thioalkalivibrio sulfidiphilus HL-EbGr7]
MRVLYPPIDPYHMETLAVDQTHRLHLETCGTAQGLPVVFLHGGPGSGCEPWHRRFFDPAAYRIVLFDQRGCGRSRPHASLEDNTTAHLVSDMERIREHLGIERWVVFGGSWGSTLALAYAEAHPERVLGLVLRGIFLCRPRDIHWFYQEGAGRLFPDYWEDYLAPIPESERDEMVSAYHRRLTGEDEVARMAAAKAWSEWEGRTATLLPNPGVVDHFRDPHVALSLARIECHYFMNQSFLEPNRLLRDAHRLADIPGTIVHGRYDVVCPLDQAHALHRAWPRAKLEIIPDAGHSAGEPGIVDALVRATDELAVMLR